MSILGKIDDLMYGGRVKRDQKYCATCGAELVITRVATKANPYTGEVMEYVVHAHCPESPYSHDYGRWYE